MSNLDKSYLTLGKFKFHRAWIMLIGCCFIQATTGAMLFGCFGNFIVPVCEELGCGRSEIGIFQTTYFIAMIPAFPVAAKLLARFSIRSVMSLSLLGLALSTILMGLYNNPWQWAISGTLAGIFSCMVFHIPPVTLVTNWFQKRVGIAMGASTAVGALAIVFLSPVLTEFIVSFGWRMTFFVEAGIMVAFSLPWCLFVFIDKPQDIGALPYGQNGSDSVSEVDDKKTMTVKKEGVSNKLLFSIPFIMLFCFSGITAIIGKGYDPHIPGYMGTLGFDAAFGALMVSALNLGSFIEKLVMGWVNDRFGVWRGAAIEIVIVLLGVIGLMVFRSPLLLLASAFLFGVQDSLSAVSLPLIVRAVFGKRNYASIYAWTRVGGGVFGSFSTMMIGASYDITQSYMPALILAIGFCLAGGLTVFVAYKTKEQAENGKVELFLSSEKS